MTQLAVKTVCTLVGLAITVGMASATSAFALASRSNAFQVYHDKDGRAYVMGNNNLSEFKIYIDGMDGVREIEPGIVILPFNNGSRY